MRHRLVIAVFALACPAPEPLSERLAPAPASLYEAAGRCRVWSEDPPCEACEVEARQVLLCR